jgi:hypothetical protein
VFTEFQSRLSETIENSESEGSLESLEWSYSPLRTWKAIEDELRLKVKTDLKKDVDFKVSRLAVMDGWAFLQGVPVTPDFYKIDY